MQTAVTVHYSGKQLVFFAFDIQVMQTIVSAYSLSYQLLLFAFDIQ